jgi:hypothetical protein
MRENRPYGSEGGEAKAFPTPITVGGLCYEEEDGAYLCGLSVSVSLRITSGDAVVTSLT